MWYPNGTYSINTPASVDPSICSEALANLTVHQTSLNTTMLGCVSQAVAAIRLWLEICTMYGCACELADVRCATSCRRVMLHVMPPALSQHMCPLLQQVAGDATPWQHGDNWQDCQPHG